VGCSRDKTIECMREKPPELLTAMQWRLKQIAGFSLIFAPTVDHKFLTKSPFQLIKDGQFQRKDIMLGANSHEGSMFVILAFPDHFDTTRDFNANVTSDEYREMVKRLRLVDSTSDVVFDTIASIYSVPCGSQDNADGVNYFMALDGMFGDVWIKCPVLRMARSYAREVN